MLRELGLTTGLKLVGWGK